MSKDLITGAEAMMRSLEHQGVTTIFGYPGGSIMPTFDALYDHQNTLNHILVRHEQGAAHAAQGYARVSGKVGVCLVTSGPGATNTITVSDTYEIDFLKSVCSKKACSHLSCNDNDRRTVYHDALYDHQNTLNHILVRHEQGAAHAAQGYARVSGNIERRHDGTAGITENGSHSLMFQRAHHCLCACY